MNEPVAQTSIPAMLRCQKRVLEMIASGAPLADTLNELLLFIEAQEAGLRCGILIAVEDSLRLQAKYGPNLPPAYRATLDGSGGGPCLEAMRRGTAIIVPDIASDPRWSERWRELVLSCGLRAVRSTPVKTPDGRVLASFAMYYDQPRDPNPPHPELVEIASNLAAIAIERGVAEQRLKDRNRRLGLLTGIGNRLILAQDPRAELAGAFEEVAVEIGAELHFNYLVDPAAGETLLLQSSGGLDDEQRRTYSCIHFGENLCGKVARDRAPIILADVDRDAGEATGVARKLGARAYAGFPMIAQDRLLGVICFCSRSLSCFPELDVELVRTVADQFATAIDRNRLAAASAASEARFRTVVDQASTGVFEIDASGQMALVNARWCEMLGYEEAELLGANIIEFIHPDDRPATIAAVKRLTDGAAKFEIEKRYCRKDGTVLWVTSSVSALREPLGEYQGLVAVVLDITERKRRDASREAQKQVLELIASDAPFEAILDGIARTIEKRSESDVRASVLLLDADGIHLRHGAAPSLPESFTRAIDGMRIGPTAGACGAAAFLRHPVYVSDTLTDPLTAGFRDLAQTHELRACWSTPILSRRGETLATFALYRREPGFPTPADLDLVGIATRLIAPAIERKQAEERLKESEARFRNMADHAPVMVWVGEADGRRSFLSQSWHEFTGQTAAIAIGFGWLEAVHPEDRTGEAFAAALAERRPFRLEYRLKNRDSGWRWVIDAATPRFGAAGEFLGHTGSVIDITERRRAEETLRDSERLARMLATIAGLSATTSDVAELIEVIGECVARDLGVSRCGYVLFDSGAGQVIVDRDYHGDRPALAGILPGALAPHIARDCGDGLATISEDLAADPRFTPQTAEAMDVRAYVNVPLRREGKWAANFWVGHHEPRPWKTSEVELVRSIADRVALVVDQARTASALSASEHRLAVALETGRLGAFDVATGTGIMTCTAQYKANFGRPSDAPCSYADVLAAIHPDDLETAKAAVAACADEGAPYRAEYRCLWPDGSVHWIDARGGRVVTGDGFHVVGVTRDVTEAKEATQRQRLMTNELNHRVKNTLAVIQSIAHQTGRHTPDPREFFEAFSARLASLASVHDILTKAAWAGAPLDQLARVSLEPFRAKGAAAIEIKGVPVLLNSGSAIAFGLTLHELATNAAKYGALSAPAGHVLVSWSLDGPDLKRLHFEWRESGGPKVDPPRRGGFGLRLIENVAAQLDADSTHEFLPEGVRYRFSMPLPRLAQAAAAAA